MELMTPMKKMAMVLHLNATYTDEQIFILLTKPRKKIILPSDLTYPKNKYKVYY